MIGEIQNDGGSIEIDIAYFGENDGTQNLTVLQFNPLFIQTLNVSIYNLTAED